MAVQPDNRSERSKGISAGNALVMCLQRLAKHHGIAVTPEALVAGLPTTLNDFKPDLLVRSAKRVGIKARLQPVSVASLPRNALPVIVLLEDEKAVLLESLLDEENALIFDPQQSPAPQPIALSELGARSAGFVLLARPTFRLRASQLGGIGRQSEHWFWSVMLEHRGLYRDVIYASLFINILALALPIFTMNV